jgi:hypothetical protein
MKDPALLTKQITDYFSWRQPYRGDEKQARLDAEWALRQTQKPPEELAVLLLEVVNERNSLLRRMRTVSIISTNQDILEDAELPSIEWAIGKTLKTKKSPASKTRVTQQK